MTPLIQAQNRINAGKIRHDDMRNNVLSDNQIADLDVDQIYHWIRNGQWKPSDFRKWLTVIRVLEDDYFRNKSKKREPRNNAKDTV